MFNLNKVNKNIPTKFLSVSRLFLSYASRFMFPISTIMQSILFIIFDLDVYDDHDSPSLGSRISAQK